jgi:hypothetical protein
MPPALSTDFSIAFFQIEARRRYRARLRAIDGFDGQPTMSLTNRGGSIAVGRQG